MPSRRVVDTSWLYALFDEEDPHHRRALKEAQRPGHYEVPSEILAETLSLRFARAGEKRRHAARLLFDSILDSGMHVVGSVDPSPAVALYREDKRLSYPDCVAVICAQDAELLTFDRRQRKVWHEMRQE